MGDIANQGEAERCRDIAKEFLSRGEFEKAAKFFDKSLRLYPLPGVDALKQKAETLARSKANGASNAHSGSTSSSPRHGASNSSSGGHSGSSQRPSASTRPNHSSSSSSHNNSSNSGGSSSSSSSSASASSPRASGGGESSGQGGEASPAAGTGANNRPYTPEQESGAAKVVMASKRCYYETLSVSKSADESEIKRAYKKLALRFHPDKNAAPSAEAAFKAINAAVETLTDASKRRMYDQLGHEGATSAAASGGGGGGGSPFGGGFHGGNMHEFTPEDMFNMFFNGGGAFGGGGFRTYNFGPGMRRRAAPGGRRGGGAEEEAAPQGGINTLFNLLPIFLLLLSMSGLFSGSGDASWQRPYSIQKAAPYTEPRYTASFGVTKDIPYFVTTTFQPSKSDLRRMEAQVEAEFKNDLYMRCDRQKRHKNRQMSDANKYRDEAKRKEARTAAENIETPACEEFFNKYKFKANIF